MTDTPDLSGLSQAELIRAERAIAAKHLNRFPWGSVAWAVANFLVWLSLWPLVLTGFMPIWLGFIIATISMSLFYLPSHEAQHDIIAKPGTKLRWLNELVGHICAMPLVIPFRVLRTTHMEHHKHANDPDLDPDYGTHAPNAWAAIWATIAGRQPGGKGPVNAYPAALERLGRKDLILEGAVYELVYYGFLFAMAWSGYAIEAAVLWWLPRHIGFTYLLFFLSWAPHNPGLGQGRYHDTRAFKSHLGNIGSMGMQFHIIHHLHPRIPLMRTPAAFWEMLPVLRARGCQLDGLDTAPRSPKAE